MDSRALTKIQTAALVAVIVVAALGGAVAYLLWGGPQQSTEDIRIGVCADIDLTEGKCIWQAATLAAEQINAEGGVLGRNFTIVAEDDDSESSDDIASATNALTKLITVDKADYVISYMGLFWLPYQDICAQQRKIIFSLQASPVEVSQRVLDDYDKYKYYFSMMLNTTSGHQNCVDSVIALRNYTGFNKVAYLDHDASSFKVFRERVVESLLENGFEIVYQNSATWLVMDFSSYFAAIEESGAQILFPIIYGPACATFMKEYHNRQSPFVIWGLLTQAQMGDFWELTEGKCEYASTLGLPTIAGYPLTNKTLATKAAYFQRWQGTLTDAGSNAYDAVRFVLPDAIKRAGTAETEAVIKTLETTNVETSSVRHFVFTSAHDALAEVAGSDVPSADYFFSCLFQWQDGTLVPVYPKQIMEEAGAAYKYPPWKGPWSK